MSTTSTSASPLSIDELKSLRCLIGSLQSTSDADCLEDLLQGTTAIQRAQHSPGEFARFASGHRWRMAKHHAHLDSYLIELAHCRRRRVMVQEPPRFGKSEHGSKYFPAWYLGKFPDRHVILASATDDLATEFSLATRDVFEEFAPQVFPGIELRRDVRSSAHWKTNKGGSMRAIGIGGGVMGRGADLFIIDDVFGKFEECLSEAERGRRHRWIHGTMKTRLSPNGVALFIGTPYHNDDPMARLLKEQAEGREQWDLVRFPAIAEVHDILGRAPG